MTSTMSSRTPLTADGCAVGQAMLHEGYSVDRVHELTKIDKWFLYKLAEHRRLHPRARGDRQPRRPEEGHVLKAKKMGFSDKQIAKAVGSTEDEVRARRMSFRHPPIGQEDRHPCRRVPRRYQLPLHHLQRFDPRVTSMTTEPSSSAAVCTESVRSVEFDWCAVSATLALREMGKKTV